METLQRTPSNIKNTYIRLLELVQLIEVEVIQFTNLPTSTPFIDRLAADIVNKFLFAKNFLNAEIVSHGCKPEDIEKRLVQLEGEFFRANLNIVPVDEINHHESSESSSLCESCENNGGELQQITSDVSSVHKTPEMVYEVVQPTGVFRELTTTVREVEGVSEKSNGGGKRWRRMRWKTVAVFATVSVGLSVSLLNYFDKKQREGFLTPT